MDNLRTSTKEDIGNGKGRKLAFEVDTEKIKYYMHGPDPGQKLQPS